MDRTLASRRRDVFILVGFTILFVKYTSFETVVNANTFLPPLIQTFFYENISNSSRELLIAVLNRVSNRPFQSLYKASVRKAKYESIDMRVFFHLMHINFHFHEKRFALRLRPHMYVFILV